MKRPLMISVIAGLITAILFLFYFLSIEEKYRAKTRMVSVLIAKGYIPSGTIIRKDMVYVRKMPQEYIQPGAFSSTKELYDEDGKDKYISLLPILEGEQLTLSKLSSIGERANISSAIPPGHVAASLVVDKNTGVGGLLVPGNRVDVLATLSYIPKGRREPTSITLTILQNVKVIAVGRRTIGQPFPVEEEREGYLLEEEENAVVLALTPLEAQMLAFARENSSLSLVLRAYGEERIHDLPPVSLRTIAPDVKGEVVGIPKEEVPSFLKELERYRKEILRSLRK